MMRLTGKKGAVLIGLIFAMVMMAALGAAVFTMTTSSTYSELLANNNNKAYQLALAGVRYAASPGIMSSLTTTTTFLMPDANQTFTLSVANGVITSTGIVNAGSFMEARRVIVFDTNPYWGGHDIVVGGGGGGTPDPSTIISFNGGDMPSFTAPATSGTSSTDAIQVSNDNTINMGGGVTDSAGSLWYQGSSAACLCDNGVCNFGQGVNVYFEFTFATEDYSANSTNSADGFTIALISGITNSRDRTGGAAPGVSNGELIGYAGPGNTADGLGLIPPKMAIMFDTYPNTGTTTICSSNSRSDPSPFANNASVVFWGARHIAGFCNTTYPEDSFDDNRHGAGGSGGDPLNPGRPDPGYYEGAHHTCKSSANSCNWMEDGYPYYSRVEIIRPSAPSGGLYNYEIKAWIARKDSIADPSLMMSHLMDVMVPYTDTTPQIDKTVGLTAQDHSDFSKFFFGFTEATGASTQQITIANLRNFCPQGTCSYSLSPTNASIAAAGGSGNIGVIPSPASCPWMANSVASWVTISSGNNGIGNGTVVYNVALNTGPTRTGYIDIAGQTFTVYQAPGTYTVTPSAGANGTINPATQQTVNYGSTTSFTVTPNAGYKISSVGGTCGGSLAGNTYTTNAITANCTVAATFILLPPTCTLTPSTSVVAYNSTDDLTWTIAGTATTASFSPTSGSCTNNVNVTGGTCTTANQTTAGSRSYTLTVNNVGGSNTCSATFYVGCQNYRVWNSLGAQYDFTVGGSCRNNINSGGEITTTGGGGTYLNTGETVQQYTTNSGSCGGSTAGGAVLSYTDAMSSDIAANGGNGNCQVNFTGNHTATDR